MNTVQILRGGEAASALAPDDRGLAYGDGLFETMRVHAGSVPWWPRHRHRLLEGAQRLGLEPPAPELLDAEVHRLAAQASTAVLKLVLTRGGGGRGYLAPDPARPTLLLSLHSPPPPPPVAGLTLRWCTLQLAAQPRLAGIKHLNRLEQVLARNEWRDPGIDEGLTCDSAGRPVCATAANLFVHRAGRWLTPPVAACGVAGVCRGWLLDAGLAHEAALEREEVESADAVFLCNAVRGILPVARLGARHWAASPAIDAITLQLAQAHPGFAGLPDPSRTPSL